MKKAKYLIILHIILALFSVSAIFSKLAALEEGPGRAIGLLMAGDKDGFIQALPVKWMIYYGAVLLFLFVYAIAWQQIIKKMPIVTAYANKAVMVIWGIIWGLIFFGEKITVSKVIGAVIIIFGVYLVVTGDEEERI